ncbi:hypothetical protein SUGI_1261010 [Cryptomeria japonica]|uniref:Uncharacterized protein n=1 Tax=Cryptomeria japonica TaxID=3369 RepID=A0AAD3NNE6_CRYJA|nr:hypothetical protein SUGI_1260970 [Cryptomeria japonica]GLJ56797.1 hypothetical protein SUGI_1260980 [Cryptomeria japonica]GLJ56798.1 hypothetical protein SUGI_1260990 [Cryptomeria japonica]GLJ56799.1 hypothetical protein SUGI_1261000 [Cryptomeria japonica]GLJ56800.1 hypothetical protein SUGI_1261010 [Cryptomeria japonica]
MEKSLCGSAKKSIIEALSRNSSDKNDSILKARKNEEDRDTMCPIQISEVDEKSLTIFEPLTVNGIGAHDMNIQAGEVKLSANRGAIVSIITIVQKLVFTLPIPNLNIGMDFLNASIVGSIAPVKGRQVITTITPTIAPTNSHLIPSRDGLPSKLWVPDE